MYKYEYPDECICAGCGKELDLKHDGHKIYCVDDKYYCEPCAEKLPKHIMKHCVQCAYFYDIDIYMGVCEYSQKPVNRYDDACEDYIGKYVYRKSKNER